MYLSQENAFRFMLVSWNFLENDPHAIGTPCVPVWLVARTLIIKELNPLQHDQRQKHPAKNADVDGTYGSIIHGSYLLGAEYILFMNAEKHAEVHIAFNFSSGHCHLLVG